MFNPIKWLWEALHGEDPISHPPEPPVEKWPLVTINYELTVVKAPDLSVGTLPPDDKL